jgi:predicted phage replisome organizer
MAEGKYYWLKLSRDFFKRHDMRIIEGMPNGKDYILFYLKLLLESIDHEGSLRFSDTIPYNEQMLSIVTNTNVDIVRSAMKIFIELNMMSVYDDQTIYMNEVEKLIGSETKWAEKKRLQRAKEDNVLAMSPNCPTEIDRELYKELYRKENIKRKETRFSKPTRDEVKEYCKERGNNVDADRFYDYYESNGWMVGKSHMKDWKASVRTWESNGYDSKPKQEASAAKKEAPKSAQSFDADDAFAKALERSYGGTGLQNPGIAE